MVQYPCGTRFLLKAGTEVRRAGTWWRLLIGKPFFLMRDQEVICVKDVMLGDTRMRWRGEGGHFECYIFDARAIDQLAVRRADFLR